MKKKLGKLILDFLVKKKVKYVFILNGGAIALGHPLGASGARLVTTALNQLEEIQGQYALCSMCIGVGQGIALIIQRVE